MSVLFCARRVSLSQSFNSLKLRRHLTTESCTGRVLFFVERMVTSVSNEHHFYSAKIQKSDTDTLLGPAIKLPPIPFKRLTRMDLSQVRNGFLCHREDFQFYIFSADTGEVSTLPEVPTPEFPFDRYMLKDNLEHYFWLDPLPNEPKVLLFQTVVPAQDGPYDYEERFWIFTRGSGSWNRIHPSSPFFDRFRSAVFANGTIHWISEESDDYSYPRQSIFAFDIVEEKFREIPHPDDSFSGKLTTFGGRLALMEKYNGFDEELPCWILKDNGKWIKETIHFPFYWRKNMDVLAFDNNTGEMLLSTKTFVGKKKCLFYYNTKTRIFRTADLTGFPQWGQFHSFYAVEVKYHD